MSNCDFTAIKTISSNIMSIILGHEASSIKEFLGVHMLKAILNEGFDAAHKECRLIKEKNLEDYFVDASDFNYNAYVLLQSKKIKEAIDLLKISIEIFPQEANLYDSLGEMFLENGDKELALENYKKSVELNPNNVGGKKAIEKLISEIE